jgi:uncharacterized protein (TIGR00369 family)
LTSDRVGSGVAREDPQAEGRFELSAHRCFACGDLNAQGIRMPLHIEPDRAWSDLEIEPRFQGWEGIAHGGILATLLDEVMAWAVASREAFGFTGRMSIEYRRPVPVGVRVRAEGRVVEARRRILRTSARIVDPATDEVYATAEGVYVTAPPERQQEMRERYGFLGATDGPGGMRRWRVRQSLPPVEVLEPVEPFGSDMPDSVAAAARTASDPAR